MNISTIGGREVEFPCEQVISDEMVSKIKLYVENAQPVGGFYRAVIANDLMGAASRADLSNRANLAAIAQFFHWNIPSSLKGSYAAVEAHIGKEA